MATQLALLEQFQKADISNPKPDLVFGCTTKNIKSGTVVQVQKPVLVEPFLYFDHYFELWRLLYIIMTNPDLKTIFDQIPDFYQDTNIPKYRFYAPQTYPKDLVIKMYILFTRSGTAEDESPFAAHFAKLYKHVLVHNNSMMFLRYNLNFDHSCHNNVSRACINGNIVYMTNRDITIGEQLYISYGTALSKTELLKNLNKKCDCDRHHDYILHAKFNLVRANDCDYGFGIGFTACCKDIVETAYQTCKQAKPFICSAIEMTDCITVVDRIEKGTIIMTEAPILEWNGPVDRINLQNMLYHILHDPELAELFNRLLFPSGSTDSLEPHKGQDTIEIFIKSLPFDLLRRCISKLEHCVCSRPDDGFGMMLANFHLFKYCCTPNVYRYYTDNKMVYMASRTIMPGEQLSTFFSTIAPNLGAKCDCPLHK